LLRAGHRFLFPADAPRTSHSINHHQLGDQRTRTYRDSGKTREISGAELRRNRQRDENSRRNS
jgi:hypothetical protein